MGKTTGFLEYEREQGPSLAPGERIGNFDEFHYPLPPAVQRSQAARCMECGVPFCQSGMELGGMTSGCPLHNLIPEWNDLVFRDNWEQALARLHKTNNFPEFTARVCPAPCEAACTCSLNGEAVSIKENERSIIETGYERGYVRPQPPAVRTGKRVAVVGSGPAGLAAADQLNRRGHSVVVYERSDRIGGLLMYGIPNMKLEKQVIDRRVKLMQDEGVRFVTGADIGGNTSAEQILKAYDSVVLACGASNPRDLDLPGRDAKGIHFAVDFLASTTKSLLDTGLQEGTYLSARDKNVLVIGGGDTGNDCVATAVRHGCRSVLQLEMMPKPPETRAAGNAWPEWPRVLKTDYGQEEAAAVFGADPRLYQTTVKEFIAGEDGALQAAILVRLEPEQDAATGRVAMKPVPGSEYRVETELVLIAAGFLGCQSYVAEAFGVETDARTNVRTAQGRYRTNVGKVFAAGDMRRGQSLVVWAIREGREAAREVDEALMGYTNLA